MWDSKSDPPPFYPSLEGSTSIDDEGIENESVSDDDNGQSGSEFAAERDLQKYLVENLSTFEPRLRLYDEEGMTGFEFPAGGRYIDILAVDGNNDLVVIELKASRGYDRVTGQLLRYKGWVETHLAGDRKVRGWIVVRDITDDLKLATSRVKDVSLYEYRINFEISHVSPV